MHQRIFQCVICGCVALIDAEVCILVLVKLFLVQVGSSWSVCDKPYKLLIFVPWLCWGGGGYMSAFGLHFMNCDVKRKPWVIKKSIHWSNTLAGLELVRLWCLAFNGVGCMKWQIEFISWDVFFSLCCAGVIESSESEESCNVTYGRGVLEYWLFRV